MNVAPRLVPGAERARCYIASDAFFCAPEKRQFPIMNRPRAVGGQVSDPAAADERVHDVHRAVLDQVRAIHEDDRGPLPARGGDVIDARFNQPTGFQRTFRRCGLGIYQKLFDMTQAFARGQRPHFQTVEGQQLGGGPRAFLRLLTFARGLFNGVEAACGFKLHRSQNRRAASLRASREAFA